jgi:alpha-1,2-mannosyltransferase
LKLRALQAAALVVGLLLLRSMWATIHDAVVALDHGDVLFADFVHHYYPTVAGPLRTSPPAGGFFYPAAFAVLLAPIGWLSLRGAEMLWGLVEIGCFLWAAFVLVREAAGDRPWLAALGTLATVTSIPMLHDLKWGQVSLPILAVSAGGFVAYDRGRKNLAAALLAVAAGIKGYPLVFVLWFVLRGDLRFVLRTAVASAVVLIVLPLVFMGPEHALWFQRMSTNAVLGAADGVLRDFNSQYAPAVLSRFYEGGWDAAPPVAVAWAKLGSGAMLAVVAALSVIAARSNAPAIARSRSLLGFALLACSVPFWLRTSWSHYFVHLPFAQTLLAAAFARSGRPRDALAIAWLVAPSVYLASLLGLRATDGWWYYANAGSLFFANALVLVGLAAFVVEAHVRVSRRALVFGGAFLLTLFATTPARAGGTGSDVQLSGLETTFTRVRGTDRNGQLAYFGFSSTHAGFGHEKDYSVRIVNTVSLALGFQGFQGGATNAVAVGLRLPAAKDHGPVVRAGGELAFFGNKYLWDSAVEIPQGHVGYQWMRGPSVVDIALKGGYVLVGRHNTGDTGSRRLDGAPEIGAIANVHFSHFDLRAKYSYVFPRRAGDDVQWFEAALCSTPGSLVLCTASRYERGDVRVRGELRASEVAVLALTIGVRLPDRAR